MLRTRKDFVGTFLVVSGVAFLAVSVYLTFLDRYLASLFSMAIGFIVLGVGADLLRSKE